MIRFSPWEWNDEDGDDGDRADTITELRAEGRARRRYEAALLRHPDPRDPDWPGHDDCETEEDDDAA